MAGSRRALENFFKAEELEDLPAILKTPCTCYRWAMWFSGGSRVQCVCLLVRQKVWDSARPGIAAVRRCTDCQEPGRG